MSNTDVLKQEIVNLTDTVRKLNKKLIESETLKQNFISNIMNELYNPFSSIMFMSDNISSLKAEQLSEAPEMAETIFREASQLDFHLKNIFAAAKLEAGLESINPSKVNLGEIINEIISWQKVLIKEKNINIVVDQTALINNFSSDKEKLSLIIYNLVSNAIKHSPDKGNVTISSNIDNRVLTLAVSDEGIGIDKQYIEVIFDRFSRIDPTINSVSGGAGLGLAVSKSLIELLDGEIHFNEGKNYIGTTVNITIPENLVTDSDDDFFFDEEL